MVTTPQIPRPVAVLGALAGYDDPLARARLRRMKLYATGLLGVAAVVFVASFALPDNTATGYIRAAAEAGMVGGLADWFAVTALFRHPLGLPIPHTALVPRKKDEIATKLGEFVEGNFVTPDKVAEFLQKSRPVQRTGEWLADPGHAEDVARELAELLTAALSAVDSRRAAEIALRVIRGDLDRRPYSPVIGELLAAAVAGRTHEPLVDVLVREAHPALIRHRSALRPKIREVAEGMGLLARLYVTDRRADRLIDDVLDLLEDMQRQGRSHPVRVALDEVLAGVAGELAAGGVSARAVDDYLRRLIEQPRTLELADRVVTDMLGQARESLAAGGELRAALPSLIRDLGSRLCTDADFAARLDAAVQSGARFVVGRYSHQIIPFISQQVAAWDAREASERIETAVGRDLQFIRINGTVVGALAGVVIYTVAVAAGHG